MYLSIGKTTYQLFLPISSVLIILLSFYPHVMMFHRITNIFWKYNSFSVQTWGRDTHHYFHTILSGALHIKYSPNLPHKLLLWVAIRKAFYKLPISWTISGVLDPHGTATKRLLNVLHRINLQNTASRQKPQKQHNFLSLGLKSSL